MEIPDGLEGIRHISTFKIVGQYLLGLAHNEILHGHKPSMTMWKGRAMEFKATFVEELKKYARQQYPFNQPVNHTRGIITWWQALEGSEFATILPVSHSSLIRCYLSFHFKF
jgi:hypothetical protein